MSAIRIVIIGGGFGGLNAAKGLKKWAGEVLIIDKTNHHLFQPLLYQVATAALSPGEIGIPIREILRKQDNASVIMGDVVSIHKNRKEVVLANGDRIDYDFLILSPGTRHSYFGNEKWEEIALGLKTIGDALKIRDQILISFEKAERIGNDKEASKFLNFVIIGGGPTGVEMAGAIAEIAYKTMFKNFRKIKPEKSKIYLVEAAPYILPMYSKTLGIRAQKDLEHLGVHVLTGKKVIDIRKDGVQIEDTFLESENIIWAAGNQASPLLKELEVPLDRQGRAIVEPDMSIPGHPEIFVIGDASFCIDKEGKPLPGIAPTAIQQGKYVAKIIRNRIPKDRRRPFCYFDKGIMATIGKSKAVVSIGKLQLTGFVAWFVWCFIHIVYLIGFRNRISVMLEWGFFFLTGQRGVRLIYRRIDHELSKDEIDPIV